MYMPMPKLAWFVREDDKEIQLDAGLFLLQEVITNREFCWRRGCLRGLDWIGGMVEWKESRETLREISEMSHFWRLVLLPLPRLSRRCRG